MAIQAGPDPATWTRLVSPSSVTSRAMKSARSSSVRAGMRRPPALRRSPPLSRPRRTDPAYWRTVERARTVTPVDVSTATATASIPLDGSSPVEVRLHDPNGRRLVGRWEFPPGDSLEIDLLSVELCRVDGRSASTADVDPDF